MNEKELKEKFIGFLGNNPGNNFFLIDKFRSYKVIELKNEALCKKFDFILAVLKEKEIKVKRITKKTIEIDDEIKGIFFRNQLLKPIAKKYQIKIQNLIVLPVEIKSNQDKLDERLANQIIDAIFIFGRSYLVLDNKHYLAIKKSGLYRILPSTIVGYSEEKDDFVLLKKHDKVYTDSLLNINKHNLIKTLENCNVEINYHNLYKNLRSLQAINQKLIYNQIFNKDPVLFENEIQFIKNLSSLSQNPVDTLKKEIINSIKETKNHKLTDFFN
ncbi:MAG: hypothetical protein M3162_09395 [Thermoproteota archaeon]|nr:hypothetical protein [Thermoproteota archaeon]